jgi:hypothetical protein
VKYAIVRMAVSGMERQNIMVCIKDKMSTYEKITKLQQQIPNWSTISGNLLSILKMLNNATGR